MTAGEPLGTRLERPHHPDGWHTNWPLPDQHQGGGPRPPLRDNQEPRAAELASDRGDVDAGLVAWLAAAVAVVLCALGALGQTVAP